MLVRRSLTWLAFIEAILLSAQSIVYITKLTSQDHLPSFFQMLQKEVETLDYLSYQQTLFVFCIIQMGQNSSLNVNLGDMARDWTPLTHDPSIYINRRNNMQLQCFHVQVSMANLLREVTIYNARTQAIFPYICRVGYFNQIAESQESHLKGFRLFAVFTDRLMTIKEGQWTIQRFVHALQAIFTLNNYYGYFRLTEKMMRVNERGQTKIWISENPANNHRDFALATEEQALAAFAGLAVRKNHEVANLLIGCRSLNDALIRLIKPKRKGSFPYNNQSHRTLEDMELLKRQNLPIYKNVFHDRRSQQKNRIYSKDGFSSAQKDLVKPLSFNTRQNNEMSGRTISQHKASKVYSRPDEDIIGRNLNSDVFMKGRPESNNIGQTSFDHFTKTPNNKGHFESTNSFISSKKYTPLSNTNQQRFKQVTQPSQTTVLSGNFSPQPERDITIINNTVNHVVNNITHNHNRQNMWNQVHNEKPSQSTNPQEHKKLQAPLFIQQRSKANQDSKHLFKDNIKSFYAKSENIEDNPTESKPFFRSTNFQSTHTSGNNNKSTQQSFRNAELAWRQPQRKSQKLFTFSRNLNTKSPNKLFSNTFSPQTPYKPFTPPAPRQQNSTANANTSIFFKKPNRTKTTDFNENSQRVVNGKGMVAQSQSIPEDVAQNLQTSKSIPMNSGKSLEQASTKSLKRQLKLEFGNLLGPGPQPQPPHNKQPQQMGQQTPPQSFLKQKIEQKKQAFAELKKQALAVLTDIF